MEIKTKIEIRIKCLEIASRHTSTVIGVEEVLAFAAKLEQFALGKIDLIDEDSEKTQDGK